jgi:hypothetical protein
MDLTTLQSVLTLTVPSLATVITLIGVVIKIIRTVKTISPTVDKKISKTTARIEKGYDDIAILKQKVESLEGYLIDKEKKK